MKLAQKIALNYTRARLNILAVISKRKAAKNAFELFCTPLRKAKKKTPDIFKKGEKLSFKLDGITIRGHRWNYPQEKKILIVHGFESTSKSFDRYVVPLLRKGYEVLAFDAPAHGQSGGKQVTLPMYIQTIASIDKIFGPVNCFLAHSFGGLVVTHFLETREHDDKTKIVMIAPATETTSAIDSFFKFLDLNADIRKEFDQLIFEKGGAWPYHYSIRRAIHNIKAQVLWFHDEDDDMTPVDDALKVKSDAHPHVEFVITKGFGHRRIYRENSVVKKVIEYL